MRRVIAVALFLEALLLLFLVLFFWNLGGTFAESLEIQHPQAVPAFAALGYVALLPPVILYAWRGALPASLLPRYVVLTTALTVTLTQLALPFAVKGGLEDSVILWAFSVALGLAYMLNRDLLGPQREAVSET